MRVLLVQPPRRYWPYVSEGDNFMLPQALPALAAPLREAGVEVALLDCMPLKIGWRSLADFVREFDPQVVACGENHALYASEALRFFKMCKEVVPAAYTVAGGAHFSNLWRHYLGGKRPEDVPGKTAAAPGCLDIVVIGEGEQTFLELCLELSKASPDLGKVDGIAYRVEGQVVQNDPRKLIQDLDSLPLPAYDLLPVHLYGRSRFLFSPGGTTIHHSRGCTSGCSFCAWWTTMAHRGRGADGKTRLLPHWRTKSPARAMEEVELLHDRYGKRSLVWVDASWNLDPRFNDSFAEMLLRSRMKLDWFAFMRADCLVRDEESGILEKLVRAGLSHVCIGVERAEDKQLQAMDKPFYSGGVAERAVGILRRRYPGVFVQTTFIVGVRDETRESLRRQAELAQRLDVDFPAFHPITPVPGTRLYQRAIEEGWLKDADFDDFDWLTPLVDSRFLTRDEIADALYELNKIFVNPRWLIRGMLSPVRYRRAMYTWFAIVSARMALDSLRMRLDPFKVRSYQRLVTPPWYET